jgi:hypothetical protein
MVGIAIDGRAYAAIAATLPTADQEIAPDREYLDY